MADNKLLATTPGEQEPTYLHGGRAWERSRCADSTHGLDRPRHKDKIGAAKGCKRALASWLAKARRPDYRPGDPPRLMPPAGSKGCLDFDSTTHRSRQAEQRWRISRGPRNGPHWGSAVGANADIVGLFGSEDRQGGHGGSSDEDQAIVRPATSAHDHQLFRHLARRAAHLRGVSRHDQGSCCDACRRVWYGRWAR